jgi:hypothetical protein
MAAIGGIVPVLASATRIVQVPENEERTPQLVVSRRMTEAAGQWHGTAKNELFPWTDWVIDGEYEPATAAFQTGVPGGNENIVQSSVLVWFIISV